jgi:hypothetical protein
VIRHDDVGVNTQSEIAPHAFECRFEDTHACIGSEQLVTVITAEGYEVALPTVLKARQAPRHEWQYGPKRVAMSVTSEHRPTQAKSGLVWATFNIFKACKQKCPLRWLTGGPFKPGFGLSGAVRQLDTPFPQLLPLH